MGIHHIRRNYDLHLNTSLSAEIFVRRVRPAAALLAKSPFNSNSRKILANLSPVYSFHTRARDEIDFRRQQTKSLKRNKRLGERIRRDVLSFCVCISVVTLQHTEERSVPIAVRIHKTLELADDKFYVITCGKAGFKNAK